LDSNSYPHVHILDHIFWFLLETSVAVFHGYVPQKGATTDDWLQCTGSHHVAQQAEQPNFSVSLTSFSKL